MKKFYETNRKDGMFVDLANRVFPCGIWPYNLPVVTRDVYGKGDHKLYVTVYDRGENYKGNYRYISCQDDWN